MEKQEPKDKIRVPIQFYIELEEKERLDRVTEGYGDISIMARKGLLAQIAERERRQSQDEKELKAS